MTPRRNVICTALIAALPALAAPPRPVDPIALDRAHRDKAIHWPKEYDPDVAPVFAHNELLIHTDCHRAFTSLADARHWPDWFILTKDVSIEGSTTGQDQTVHRGTLLRLKIFNSPIQSRIVEFVPDERISWIPFGADETETRHGHYHAWHLIPEPAGCRVVTEETGIGPYDLKDPQAGSRVMHRAHALWLASLQWVAEP